MFVAIAFYCMLLWVELILYCSIIWIGVVSVVHWYKNRSIIKMKNEMYHPVNEISCECSVNSIYYDATNLRIVLDRFDNNQAVVIHFENVYAYRLTLEHFRISEVMDGLTTMPLYEVENSAYLSQVMETGMGELYGTSLNVRHYAINTAEHIIDILTSEIYVIE